MAQGLLAGWLRCPTGRDELVAISVEQRDQLLGGELVCPSCARPCVPTFEPIPLRADMQVTRLRDGRWVRGFVLL